MDALDARHHLLVLEEERSLAREQGLLDDPPRDAELEQLEAEARYHKDRFDLYQARVISGRRVATSATRLRELKRTATAAAERLAHARRKRKRSSG